MIIKVDDEVLLDLCCASELAFQDGIADAKQWISDAIMGKAWSCAMNMIERWKDTLMAEDQELQAMSFADAQAILANPELCIPRIVECPSYKNYLQRQSEQPLNPFGQ